MFCTTTLQLTFIICCTVSHFVFSTIIMTSQNHETDKITDIPPTYHCNNSLQCPSIYGFSGCENHLCVCDENYFYPVYNYTSQRVICHACSVVEESCATTKCCQNPLATVCLNGVCVCRPGMNDECLDRYTPTLGIQLANTLSISFAFVFLAITFVAVVRKTFSCSFCRCDSISRVNSDSSLNEFVKQKMQNRPPCYDDIEKDRKVPIEIDQPPPEYSTVTHIDRTDTFWGILNPTFLISDDVEMNTAPPNYSTFTTVTNVNSMTTPPPNWTIDNNEIILTQPIYLNSSRRQT